jgi:osmoprotectant transport system permease protein
VSVAATIFNDFGNAIDFILHKRESVAGSTEVGGSQLWPLLKTHLLVVLYSMVIAAAVSIPLALWLGHRGKGQFAAASAANVGRAVPSIAVLVFFSAYLGLGTVNLVFAMVLLAIPPIFTNTYVGVRQVDRDAVDAARGMGMSGWQIVGKVELPLALPLLFGGLRTSTVNVIATATLGPLVGVLTLGDAIINANVYGPDGRLAGAILVALLAVLAEVTFALLQRAVTPRGLRVSSTSRRSLWRRPAKAGSTPPTIPAP